MVERRGEVAVRGGLVDFFPPGEDHPVRVELWGDEVESIRAFAVSSQRSLTELPRVEAWPCREVRLGEAERGRARQPAAEGPVAGGLPAQGAEGLDVEGVESLLPLLFDDLQPLTAYLPGDAVLVLLDPKGTLDRAEEVRRRADQAGPAPPGPHPLAPSGPNVPRLAADARELVAAGSTVLYTTEGAGPAQRLVEVL